jgi:hypothetical protein
MASVHGAPGVERSEKDGLDLRGAALRQVHIYRNWVEFVVIVAARPQFEVKVRRPGAGVPAESHGVARQKGKYVGFEVHLYVICASEVLLAFNQIFDPGYEPGEMAVDGNLAIVQLSIECLPVTAVPDSYPPHPAGVDRENGRPGHSTRGKVDAGMQMTVAIAPE